MFITATEVTILSSISASAATITASGLIPMAEDKLNRITYNYFETEMDIQSGMVFNATARTIVSTGNFVTQGFLASDKILVYGSYRNDGYYEVSSVATTTLTLVTGSTVVDELSGQSIFISVVDFPESLKITLAQMIKYDYDDRKNKSADLVSKRLGPWSETYKTPTSEKNTFGYPEEITAALASYTIARLM